MYYRDVTHGDNCKQIKLKAISEPQVPCIWTFLKTEILRVLETKVANSFREQFLLKASMSSALPGQKVATTTESISASLETTSIRPSSLQPLKFNLSRFRIRWPISFLLHSSLSVGVLIAQNRAFLDFLFVARTDATLSL